MDGIAVALKSNAGLEADTGLGIAPSATGGLENTVWTSVLLNTTGGRPRQSLFLDGTSLSQMLQGLPLTLMLQVV